MMKKRILFLILGVTLMSMSVTTPLGAQTADDKDLAGKLVKKEWLDRAFTPYKLKNGESTGYGYGWFRGDFGGHPSIEHGGGIHGFTSYEMTFPEDGVFLAILTNGSALGRAPEPRAVKIAWLALGLAEPERKTVSLTEPELEPLTGVYLNVRKQEFYVSREGNRLFAQRKGGAKDELLPASPASSFWPTGSFAG